MTTDSQPAWFKLLKYWQFDQEVKRSSLSYSLLVGAYDAFGIGFGDCESVEDFSKNLTAEMNAVPIGGCSAVAVPCPYIGRAVSLVKQSESGEYAQLEHGDLWGRYSEGLVLRNYSVEMQKFLPFSKNDVNWMTLALGLAATDEYCQFANIAV